MKSKTLIIIAILFLSIGFATISTTLFLNGGINVGTNEEDFDVYFSNAILDGKENLSLISDNKKVINFETAYFSKIGDKSILKYEVTNASTQYDANVSVICTPSETDIYKVTNVQDKEIIEARNIGNGVVTVELKKNVVEEQKINFTCAITMSAGEREEANTGAIVGSCEFEIGTEWEFGYIGKEEIFSIPCAGEYKLETWGAQGGSGFSSSGGVGGFGAYATGTINFDKMKNLYINVGEAGKIATSKTLSYPGGYNGGGNSRYWNSQNTYNAPGGGATHIATKSGLLSTLENSKEDILIVAGSGGGGSSNGTSHVLGGHAGGISGGTGSVSPNKDGAYGLGGTQTSGGKSVVFTYTSPGAGSFGKGGIYSSVGGAGGGAGYYGGGGASVWMGAGGGSSYIGNPNLTDKIMYCYNCATSTAEATRTETTNQVSPQPEKNKAKQGNGYAKITLVSLN